MKLNLTSVFWTYIVSGVLVILSTSMSLASCVEVTDILDPAGLGVFRHSACVRRPSDRYQHFTVDDPTAEPVCQTLHLSFYDVSMYIHQTVLEFEVGS